jgi:CHAD domain-containing protein
LRTVELVLEMESKSASEWVRQRSALANRGKRRAGGKHKAGEASAEGRASEDCAEAGMGIANLAEVIADALKQADGIALLHPREPEHRRVFDKRGAGWRVLFKDPSGEWRVLVLRKKAFVPGVIVRDTVFDEPLEGDRVLSPNVSLPPALKKEIGGDDELAPSPEIEIYRTVWQWSGPEGPSVEIALHDALDALSSDPWVRAGGMPAFCELHLSVRIDAEQSETGELPRADGKFAVPEAAIRSLFGAARSLSELLPVTPALTDAYARASGEATSNEPVRAPHIDLAGAATPHEALIAIGGNVTRQWFDNQQGARDSASSEFVHQMRVGLRRLKTTMKLFPRWFDDTGRTHGAPDLKWIGATLGEVRDLDVFAESTLPAMIEADVDASAWSGVRAAAEARGNEARARLQEALRSRRYAQLALAWLDWLASQRFSAGPPAFACQSLADYAAKRVRKHFRRLTAKPALSSLDADARHRRRIEAKRLRYALEFFEPLTSKRTRRVQAKQLGRIQSVLGEGSDAMAALRFMEQLDVPTYQLGFARGWGHAVNCCAAHEAERLLAELRKPKIARRAARASHA